MPATLALGHAYASIGDHDQAIGAYSNIVKRLDDGCIPAHLSIGGEYLRVRKPALAAPSVHAALSIDKNDPFALNELGVLLYLRREWEPACQAFRKAHKLLRESTYGPFIDKSLRENLYMASLRTAFETRDLTQIRAVLSKAKGSVPIVVKELQFLLRQSARLQSNDDDCENVAPLLLEAAKIGDRKRSLRVMDRILANSPLQK